MTYKEVEGIDENGNPTTFKIEIPSAKKALQGVRNYLTGFSYKSYLEKTYLKIIEQALNDYDNLQKTKNELELTCKKQKEVLDIIIKKNVNMDYFKVAIHLNSYGYYNSLVGERRKLTENEFNLIKERLSK